MFFNSEIKLNKNDGGVYMIVNNAANGVYIGSTHDFHERFSHHERRARQLYYTCPLYEAMREYGSENFTFVVLAVEEDLDKRLKEEERLINEYDSVKGLILYNVIKHPGKPVFMTEELKKKLSYSHKKGNERHFNKETMKFEK